MGCCISKCKPKTKPQSNPAVVQDKLVIISQSPPSSPPPSPPRKRRTVPSPPSTTAGSVTCSTQSSTCGSSSLSSTSSSSSIAFSKVDRTFSNEFLHSCAIENAQIIGYDPIKKIGSVKPPDPSSAHKRARAGSPTLTRQKSFRIEKERLPYGVVSGRSTSTMRTPSPSRRFNGSTTSYQRGPMLSSMSARNESNRVVKANYSRPPSPNRSVISKERVPPHMCLKNKERFESCEVGSKVEGVEVREVLSKMGDIGCVATEDLDNPHIALDCFIFL